MRDGDVSTTGGSTAGTQGGHSGKGEGGHIPEAPGINCWRRAALSGHRGEPGGVPGSGRGGKQRGGEGTCESRLRGELCRSPPCRGELCLKRYQSRNYRSTGLLACHVPAVVLCGSCGGVSIIETNGLGPLSGCGPLLRGGLLVRGGVRVRARAPGPAARGRGRRGSDFHLGGDGSLTKGGKIFRHVCNLPSFRLKSPGPPGPRPGPGRGPPPTNNR